jgi:hypothetical protein
MQSIRPGANVIKLFTAVTTFHNKLERLSLAAYSYRHSSLLRKSLIYGQKSFITLSPGANVIKLFTAVI